MLRVVLGLIFIVLPLLELTLLIKTGQLVGFWATLAMVVGAGLLGALILSRQSLAALRRTMEAAERGRPPVAPALDGAFLMLAGALLITPGFLTDVIALLLLVPPLRRGVARWTVKRVLRRGGFHGDTLGTPGEPDRRRPHPSTVHGGEGPIIEGEFERLGEKPTDRQTDKP